MTAPMAAPPVEPGLPGRAPLPPAYWFLWRLVRFRPWMWGLNLLAITT